MGTFRQGKSFLLNLLAHYFEWLQAQQQDDNWQPRARDEDYRLDPQTESEGGQKVPDPEWIPDTVKEHFKVDGEQDAKACTVGVWLLSQPYLLRKPGSRERVAVLLMDSQGAFDGQLEAKQSRAILGITAVLASTVIYNVKPFAADAVQHLSDLTCISEDAVQNAAEGSEQVRKCCLGRMCILVRDKKYPMRERPTLADCSRQVEEEAQKFIEPEHVVDPSARAIVEKLRKSFAQLGVFGLSKPGEAVQDGHSQDPREFNKHFKKLVDECFRQNFEVDFPVPLNQCITGEPITADNIKEYLQHLLIAFADCDLQGGTPYLIAYQKRSKALKKFKEAVEKRRPELDVFWPEQEMEEEKEKTVSKFRSVLTELNLHDTSDNLVNEFEQSCQDAISSRRVEHAKLVTSGQMAVGAVAVGGVGAHFVGLTGLCFAHPVIALVAAGGIMVYAYKHHAQQNEADIYDKTTIHSFWEVSKNKFINFFRSAVVLGHKVYSRAFPSH